MPNVDGLEATRRLLEGKAEGPRILILTTFDLDEYVWEALRAGASGFLLKDTPPEQLVDAIRVVAAGDALLAPAITRRVIEEFVSRPPGLGAQAAPGLDELTARELEMLRYVARGLSNAEIAEAAFVSETTVKTHVAHILMKLRLRDRVQAVVFAYEHGIVAPGHRLSRPESAMRSGHLRDASKRAGDRRARRPSSSLGPCGSGSTSSSWSAGSRRRAARRRRSCSPGSSPGTRSRASRSRRMRSSRSSGRRGSSRAAARSSRTRSPRSTSTPPGRDCADVGASTGGFTDCLLQAGAARVVAIDVGYGQLHPRLRADPRVTVLERVNARELEELPFAPDLVVCDVSFISVTKALPPVLALARPGWEALVLVKPQFEASRSEVGKGVVRDPAVQRRVVEGVIDCGAGVGWSRRRRRRLGPARPEGEPGVLRPPREPTGRTEPR